MDKASSAPPITIPVQDEKLLRVEHPGVVKALDNAEASLGGKSAISKFLHSDDSTKRLRLYLNRQDPFRKPIPSHQKTTSDVALKITLPKRTGRKRKRGSSGDFLPQSSTAPQPSGDVHHLLRSLQDNPHAHKIESIGKIQESHRFRALPDFQYSLASSTLADSVKKHITPFKCDDAPSKSSAHVQANPSADAKIKDFSMDLKTKGTSAGNDMIPPPSFAQLDVMFPYAYYQNPHVELTVDESGKQTTINMSTPRHTKNSLAKPDDEKVPQGPPPDIEPIESLDSRLQEAVRALGPIFEERPIVTRRVLHDRLGHDFQHDIRHAVRYHAYIFRSGPWRDAFVKYGLDPRADPKWRKYQTFMFQIPIKEDPGVWEDGRTKWGRSSQRVAEPLGQSYIFDGQKIIPNSKVWQACDITDPLLRKVLDDEPPRETLHPTQDGWFKNGVWAKVRVIMRDKITLLLAGVQPNDADYKRCVDIPNDIKVQPASYLSTSRGLGKREGGLVQEIMNIARASYSQQLKSTSSSAAEIGSHGELVERPSENAEEEEIDTTPWRDGEPATIGFQEM